jgi:LPXTG-motif cell wall-anchored protein
VRLAGAVALVVLTPTGVVAWAASPAAAQVPGITATFGPIVPSPGRPGTTSATSVTFTVTEDLGPVQVNLDVTAFNLFNPPVAVDTANTTSELINCALQIFTVMCDWDAQIADGPQTLAVSLAVPADNPWPDMWSMSAFVERGNNFQPLADSVFPIGPPLGSMALSGTALTPGGVLANACLFLIAETTVLPVVADGSGNWSASGLPDGVSFVIAVTPAFSGPAGPCQLTGPPPPAAPGELQPEWVDNIWIDLADPDLINNVTPFNYAVAHGATVFSSPTSGIVSCLTTTPRDVVPRPPCSLTPATTAPSSATTDPGTTTSPTAAPTSAASGTLPATGGSGGGVPVAGLLALVAGAALLVSQRRRRLVPERH